MLRNLLPTLLIIALASYCRFGFGLYWDQKTLVHPDERFLAMESIKAKLPSSFKEYLNPKVSTLNPLNNGTEFYPYGTLPLLIDQSIKQITGVLPKQENEKLFQAIRDRIGVSRAITLTLDLMSVFLVMAGALLLFDKAIALWAGFFLATSVTNIQLARFFTADPFAYFFLCAAFFLFALWARYAQQIFLMLSVAAFAAACACKISILIILPAFLIAFCFIAKRHRHTRFSWWVVTVMLCMVTAVFTFRLLQPYTFSAPFLLDFSFAAQWKQSMVTLKDFAAGIFYPPSLQWVNRTPIVFSLKNFFLWSPGFSFSLLLFLGLLWGITYHRYNWRFWFLCFWFLVPFLIVSSQFIKPTRYFLPLMPAAAILAAFAVNKLLQSRAPAGRITGVTLVVIHCFWTYAFTSIYRVPHTRAAASEWMYDSIPCGTVLVVEDWDEILPLNTMNKSVSKDCYQWKILPMYDQEDVSKRTTITSYLNDAEYIVISSQRIRFSIEQVPHLYPLSRVFYRELFLEKLGFSLEKRFISRPTFLEVSVDDINAEESLTVYDHPAVYIFKKNQNFSVEMLESLLPETKDIPLPKWLLSE